MILYISFWRSWDSRTGKPKWVPMSAFGSRAAYRDFIRSGGADWKNWRCVKVLVRKGPR